MLSMLKVIRFVVSALISIPFAVDFWKGPISCASSCLLLAGPSKSSGNLMLLMVRPAMLIISTCSATASDIILSKKMLIKSRGDFVERVQPLSYVAIDEECTGGSFIKTLHNLADVMCQTLSKQIPLKIKKTFIDILE